jgi:signal transduction histidine kinase
MDLVAFVCDYIDNISKFSVNNVKIELINASQLSFISLFSPIEMMIVIDNIINNSEKARSKNIKIVFEKLDELNLEIRFIDDGIGIPRENISKIFTFGFTTTTGSGIGLSHVSEILAKINASINVNPDYNKGAEFVLTFKKRIK